VVEEVNVLDSQDAANLALLTRPELGITFTKLHCWRLTQFSKCVFLDADTLVSKKRFLYLKRLASLHSNKITSKSDFTFLMRFFRSYKIVMNYLTGTSFQQCRMSGGRIALIQASLYSHPRLKLLTSF
jgi:hypothetical protein